MKDSITKRYVKAIMESFEGKSLEAFMKFCGNLNSLYSMDKFITILQSPDVAKEKKLELVLLDNKDKKIQNLMKILSENDRLLMIPSIYEELKSQVSQQKNIYEGEVFSDWKISKEQLGKLEEGFSKKFGATVKLNATKCDYPGLKISVDSLGVEASFSVERLKAQIAEHILKAI